MGATWRETFLADGRLSPRTARVKTSMRFVSRLFLLLSDLREPSKSARLLLLVPLFPGRSPRMTVAAPSPVTSLRRRTWRPQEACQVQVCFQDSDEDPARPREGRGGEPDREEDHHSGPLRDPWQVHLEARLSLHSLWISNPMMLLKLKVLIVLPS